MFTHDLGPLSRPRYVINFPTKRHWKGKSRLEDIDSGLIALVAEVRRLQIRSIAVPPWDRIGRPGLVCGATAD